MTSTLLLVMNPREIEECLESIRALDIDKLWLTCFTEYELQAIIAEAIERTEYDRYTIVSDDGIYPQAALDAVLALHDERGDVATGYSNLDPIEPYVNLTKSPLPVGEPMKAGYDLYTQAEIDALPDPVFRTFFTGMCLTTMTKDCWRRYPFQVYSAMLMLASDYKLSQRLRAAHVPIWAHRDGRVHHVKEVWNAFDRDPRKRLLIGEKQAEVRFEARAG